MRNQIVTQQATYRQKLAQIEQAKTDIGFFETSAQRQQDLLKRGVSAQATFDQAKRDLDTARERLEAAIAGDVRDNITAAAEALETLSKPFAERRMDRGIREALSGMSVSDLETRVGE